MRFLTILMLLFAMGLYRLSPTYPRKMELTFFDWAQNMVGLCLYNVLLKAEEFGWIRDSATMFRKVTHTVMPDFSRDPRHHSGIQVQRTIIANVPVLIFRPDKHINKSKKHGALIYIHGGGFMLFSASTHFLWTKKLAVEAGVVVISVDYRLAPQHPFPAGLEDCLAVTKAVFDEAELYGIDPSRIMIGGDSAGGNLAAIVAIELASSPRYRLKAQLLLSPILQALELLPSIISYAWYIPFPRCYLIAKYLGLPYSNEILMATVTWLHVSTNDRERFAPYLNMSSLSTDLKLLLHDLEPLNNVYFPPKPPKPTPKISIILTKLREIMLNERAWPLLTTDDKKLRRLPPAFLSVAEFDPLRDEELLYYDRLRSLGVNVTLSYMRGTAHIGPTTSVMMKMPISENAQAKYIPDMVNFIKVQLT